MIRDSDPIELYLDQLVEEMHGPGKEIRRALAETEDHLREAQREAMEAGIPPLEAARVAIENFGSPRIVASRYDLLRTLASPRQTALQAFLALLLVGSFVFIGIGISGLAAAVGAVIYGPGFIAGDPPGVVYTAERCADFFEFHPETTTCGEAAIAHHLDETVGYRLDTGVVGVLALAGWWLLKTIAGRRTDGPPTIPPFFVPVATLILFTAAFIFLGGLGTMLLVSSGLGSGAGAFISAAVVSLLAAVGFGTWVLRSFRNRTVDPPLFTTA
jgi:hypothetical protein